MCFYSYLYFISYQFYSFSSFNYLLMRFIFVFIVCLISSDVIGQGQFIETKYSRGFNFLGTNRLQYSSHNTQLDDVGLRRLFEDNATSQNLLQTARRDKGIGLPLVILGSAGMISSLLFLDNSNTDVQTGDWIFLSSMFVGSLGSAYMTSFERNRIRAVNNYNSKLYEELALGDTDPLIELEYSLNPFRFMAYYQEGQRLNNRALTSYFSQHSHLQDLMKKANLQRGIGTGLLIGGVVGVIAGSALLFEEDRSGLILAGGSLVSMISGGILLSASRANRQSAVNLYNKQLFESATGTATLNFKLNPNAGGLVLNF